MAINDYRSDEKMQWCLQAVVEEGREWLVTIKSVPFVIGRADDCDLKLNDKRISRSHSEMRISGDLLWIRDLESTNGTFVNGKLIEHAILLEPDDIVSIDRQHFRVKRVNPSDSSLSAEETVCDTLSGKFQSLDAFEPLLLKLIQERNVIPHFQPLVKFSDSTGNGYEILGRIGDASLPSNPAELLELAEFLGCGTTLSSLFREMGVEIGKKLPGSPALFVNTTQFELADMDGLIASLQRIRDLAPAGKVVLEINEKAAANTNEFPQLRDELKKINMGLAFDDFGVGQTRLVELSNISPDYLKFDMSLIRQIHLAPKRLHQMISTFIKASHDLGILTVAEGVECTEESEVCQMLGFDLAQGYFFGRPVPIDAIANN